MRTVATDTRFYVNQVDQLLDQLNPISGTPYAIGVFGAPALIPNVRIIGIALACTWTVQPSPLELHMIIDGQAYTFAVANPVSAANYEATIVPSDQILDDEWNYSPSRAFLIEGKSVELNAEITGGTVQNLSSWVKWARYM